MIDQEGVRESLERVQTFDPEMLPQKDRLSKSFRFDEAVEPAKKLVALFKKLPAEILPELADQQLKQVGDSANAVYNTFEQIISFDETQANSLQARASIITNITSQYQTTFNAIYPIVSYAMARTVDFSSLAHQGQAAIQSIRDQTSAIQKELESTSEEAEKILEEVREAAAEQGVSQQASYFASEANRHAELATKWRDVTWWTSGALALYSFIMLFSHSIPFLAANSVYGAIQFTTSKFLFAFVLGYLVFLSARNFLSHRHNQIVNTHRQNALMTYRTLVDAGGTPEARDSVLSFAAAAIYQLHDTGYTKHGSDGTFDPKSPLSIMPKATLSTPAE
ncbi:hypothetical protein [Parvularcula oceani]|uniref:hypothetical protein n=1 Tax=Parvularcula oceani TaxID=1247963 RepID=UPI0004E17322|nr:hypothetical protein [Parvularcula oceani]